MNAKTITVKLGDITCEQTDAIVNAANTSLLGGGGVDGAIHRAAGPELLKACRELHGCATGDAKITPAFNLPARYVIHTPGPVWRGGEHGEDELLRSSWRTSLQRAEENGLETVSFPSVSTGIYGFPLQRAAHIAMQTVKDFLAESTHVKTVTVVAFDDRTAQAYQHALDALLSQ